MVSEEQLQRGSSRSWVWEKGAVAVPSVKEIWESYAMMFRWCRAIQVVQSIQSEANSYENNCTETLYCTFARCIIDLPLLRSA